MNNKEITGKIGLHTLRTSQKANETGKSYANLHVQQSFSHQTSPSEEQKFDSSLYGADRLAQTVLHAQKLRNWAKKAKRSTHILERELDSIDLFMFHPFENFKIKWDMAVMVVMLYVLIEIPYRVCLEVEVGLNHPYEIFNLLVDIVLMMDIIFTFNTGFIENGEFITNRRRIAFHYFLGWFWLDFITSIPLTRILSPILTSVDSGASYLTRLPRLLRLTKVVRMIKLLRVFKLYRAMSQWENLNESGLNMMFRVSKFFLIVFLIAHISACIWIGIAVLYVRSENEFPKANPLYFISIDWHPNCWIMRAGFEGFHRGHTYLFGLYWAFTTLTTVGYGDITAELPMEIAFTILIMICGTSLFGYIIGNVASVMTHEDETAVLIKNKIQSVTAYMRYRQFPRILASKIQRHYEYSWKRTQVYNEEEILQELPTTVRTEVALYIHRETILKVPFLKELGEDVVPMLVLKLKPINASPRDVIIKEDYFGEEMYFVVEGELKMFLGGGKVKAKQRKRVQHWLRLSSSSDSLKEEEIFREMEIHVGQITKGDYFGEYAIILDCAKHPMSVRSLTYCDLFSMSKEDFEDISDHFPAVFDQVIMIGQKRYLQLMRKLQQKRRWATAAVVRGVSLQKIEGEDASMILEPDAHPDKPVGFMARYRRRLSLKHHLMERKASLERLQTKQKEEPKRKCSSGSSAVFPVDQEPPPKSRVGRRKTSLLPAISLIKVNLSATRRGTVKESSSKPLLTKDSSSESLRHSKISEIPEDSVSRRDSCNGVIKQGSRRKLKSIVTDKLKNSVIEVETRLHKAPIHPTLPNKLKKSPLSSSKRHLGSFGSSASSFPSVANSPMAGSVMNQQKIAEEKRPKLSIHMLAKLKMWKNRAVMNVALNNMASKERRHRRKIRRRARGADSRASFSSQPSSLLHGSGDGPLDEAALQKAVQPLIAEVDRVADQQNGLDQRLGKLEVMLQTMFEHAEDSNESLVAMARILGQIANEQGVSPVNAATRALCHMDSTYSPEIKSKSPDRHGISDSENENVPESEEDNKKMKLKFLTKVGSSKNKHIIKSDSFLRVESIGSGNEVVSFNEGVSKQQDLQNTDKKS